MALSGMITYQSLTSNMSSGRGSYKPVYIAIHHMAGNLSVQQCGNVFKNNEVSAHYGINGTQIGGYVDENNTAWALGNFKRNQQSINIELANDGGSPNWSVSDTTIQTCIKLVADIAYRLGWTYISYTGDLNGDIIAHKWVASTACPGPYLYGKLEYIAKQADVLLKKKLGGGGYTPTPAGKLVEDGIIGYNTILALQKFLKSPYADGEISGQLPGASDYVLAVTDDWVFIEGGKGSSTIELFQRYLNEQIKAGLELDGYFGEKSVIALQKFLNTKGHRLTVDGLLGTQTAFAFQKWLNSL